MLAIDVDSIFYSLKLSYTFQTSCEWSVLSSLTVLMDYCCVLQVKFTCFVFVVVVVVVVFLSFLFLFCFFLNFAKTFKTGTASNSIHSINQLLCFWCCLDQFEKEQHAASYVYVVPSHSITHSLSLSSPLLCLSLSLSHTHTHTHTLVYAVPSVTSFALFLFHVLFLLTYSLFTFFFSFFLLTFYSSSGIFIIVLPNFLIKS